MGRNGPNVEWVGLIVRTDDGQVHAVEMDGRGGRVTADLVLNPYNTRNEVFPITAIINGVGKYWQEGATMGPDVQPRRELRPGKIRAQTAEEYAAIEQAVIQGVLVGKKPRAIEGGEGDGTRT